MTNIDDLRWNDREKVMGKDLAMRFILHRLHYIQVRKAYDKSGWGELWDSDVMNTNGLDAALDEVRQYAVHHGIPMTNNVVGDALARAENDWNPSDEDCY
jgi:hypothetical protein